MEMALAYSAVWSTVVTSLVLIIVGLRQTILINRIVFIFYVSVIIYIHRIVVNRSPHNII